MSTALPAGRSRQRAEVVRLDSQYAYLSFPSWCAGQVLVRVPAARLSALTGRTGAGLLHAEVSATITTGALLEDDLDPRDWQAAGR